MIRASAIGAILFSLAIGGGTAWADNPQPPGANQHAAAKMSASDKSAVSKSCTDQANAKGLHGKARKKFRSACKKAGGKMQ